MAPSEHIYLHSAKPFLCGALSWCYLGALARKGPCRSGELNSARDIVRPYVRFNRTFRNLKDICFQRGREIYSGELSDARGVIYKPWQILTCQNHVYPSDRPCRV